MPDHLQLMSNEWKQLKKGFEGSSSLGTSVMQLPFSLVKAMPQQVHAQLADRSGYEDILRLADAEVAGFFDSTVDHILELVEQMVQRGGVRPDRLVLVGEFSSSSYLQLKMEGRFGGWHPTACSPSPLCPGSAVPGSRVPTTAYM
jgi:hypothetical protein